MRGSSAAGVGLALALSVVACTGCTDKPERAGGQTCAATHVRGQVMGFLDAFNRGDAAAETYFAQEPTFEWYSDERRFGDLHESPLLDPRNRSSLGEYLLTRYRAGDRLTAETVTATTAATDAPTGRGPKVDVVMKLRHPLGMIEGKGAYDCGSRAFMVWSLGDLQG
jgi:hypothetical protein